MSEIADELAALREAAQRYGIPVDSLVGRLTLRVDEVAQALGVSPRTVQGWVASGRIGASRPGRVLLIPPADVLRLLDATKVRPAVVDDTRSRATQLIREQA